MNEIWVDIIGYEGLYQISNLGRVKSLERMGLQKRILKETILKGGPDKDGYKMVILYKNTTRKTIRVHREVVKHFTENPENKPCVNHKNGIKDDNRLENLEWCTVSENTLHAFKTLNRVHPAQGKIGKLNPKSTPIIQYDLQMNFIKEWDSIRCAARSLGAKNGGSIVNYLKGINKTAYGYKWGLKNTING